MNLLIADYDYDVDIAVQREEALQEDEARGFSLGIAQGEAKGSYQKAIETAKNLLGLGMPIEAIAQATGLTQAEVEAL